MNTFGRVFRLTLYGESHGEEIGVVIDGCPAGILIGIGDFALDLERRQAGAIGTTLRQEPDLPLVKSGLLNQRTTGSPLTISFKNEDVRSEDYLDLQLLPRPGHADFVAHQKYGGFHDYRGGGHFSGRLTIGVVAAGVIAKKILAPILIKATLLEAGGSKNIKAAVRSVLEKNDSIGGLIECRVKGLPIGLGEPFFDSVESLISHLVFSIPGIKGIEFGSGFACARMKGSECNDIILNREGKTKTNHAGGINGGITNGNELIFRVAVKPPSSIKLKQRSIHLGTGKAATVLIKGRHDACIALRMPVIIEAAAAIVLADLMLLEQKIRRVKR